MDKVDVYEIDKLTLGIYSAEEIEAFSVCEITSTKVSTSDKGSSNMNGTVYDPRMGPFDNGIKCVTCGLNNIHCVGHHGFIRLRHPVIHPQLYKQIIALLKCTCINCYKLLITKEQIKLNGFHKMKNPRRFQAILEKLEKVEICSHCDYTKPIIVFNGTNEKTINLVYKKDTKTSREIEVDEIKKIFENLTESDVQLLGFDPKLMMPKNLIITNFPIVTISARPYVITNGNIQDDDLTFQAVEIIKANNNIAACEGKPNSEKEKRKYIKNLQFRIETYMNNSCLVPETPVLMWNGNTKRIDEIIIGDEIIGDNGEKRTVLETHSGVDKMFEISQENGDTYTVNSRHQLTLKFVSHKRIIWCNSTKAYKNGAWKIQWFDKRQLKSKYFQPSSLETKEDAFKKINKFALSIDDNNMFDIYIKDYMNLPKYVQKRLLGFKMYKSVNWKKKEILLDPYLLGMWLGDGLSKGIGFTSADEVLVNYWKQWASENECEIVLYQKKIKEGEKGYSKDEVNYRPKYDFGIKSINNQGNFRNNINPFKEILRKYNLINNKHIPNDYLFNDTDTRLKLLAGMIDTDGYKEKNTLRISQCEKRKDLIFQFQYLIRSLGFQCSMSFEDTGNYIKDGSKTTKRYILRLSGQGLDKIPILLDRKKVVSIRDTLVSSIKIKPIERGKFCGITIDENNRFILGDFTVTKNSGKATHNTNNRAIRGLKERLSAKDGLVRNNLMGERLPITGEY